VNSLRCTGFWSAIHNSQIAGFILAAVNIDVYMTQRHKLLAFKAFGHQNKLQKIFPFA
jgi:hypothetical protein